MKLTSKLIARLNRVFRKTGNPVIALRVDSTDGSRLLWTVADGVLTLTPASTLGATPASIDLSTVTIAALATRLASLGYLVPVANIALSTYSALVLMDGSGDTFTSDGDALWAWTDWHYGFLDAAAAELDLAVQNIQRIPLEMATTTADGEWLDSLGTLYAVPRMAGETDGSYGPRIIAEVLRPKSNNKAMELLIQAVTGQSVTVTDVSENSPPFPQHNGAVKRDGTYHYTSITGVLYGLFDVVVGYDLLGGSDPATFEATCAALANRIRAAGTYLRSLSLTGSILSDAVPAPADGGDSLTLTYAWRRDGTVRYGGQVQHQPTVLSGTLQVAGSDAPVPVEPAIWDLSSWGDGSAWV